MAFTVFLDACTIYGAVLADFLLTLAERGTYRPLWSGDVLIELARNLEKAGISKEAIQHRIDSMNSAFPDAAINGYSQLVDQMTCHEKDRHVLAAAIRGGAAIIVTFNLKDFPEESLKPFDIKAVHPDAFLLDQLDLYKNAVVEAVNDTPAEYEHPPMPVSEFLSILKRSGVPSFVKSITPLV